MSLTLAVGLTFAGAFTMPANSTRQTDALCDGHRASIVGGRFNDILFGSPHRDVIAGLRGNDTIISIQGDDIVCGGRGQDVLNGGRDEDTGRGGPGRDVCFDVEHARSCKRRGA